MRLVPELIEELKKRGSDVPVVIGGSVITPEDAEKMRQAGVAGVFTNTQDSDKVIECVRGLSAARKRSDQNGRENSFMA
jgi:methylmalonyl-CoA mutase C-terminal domain/subunit